jgi:hypothetical protein
MVKDLKQNLDIKKINHIFEILFWILKILFLGYGRK